MTIVPNPDRIPALNGMDWLIRIENAATGSKFEVKKIGMPRPFK